MCPMDNKDARAMPPTVSLFAPQANRTRQFSGLQEVPSVSLFAPMQYAKPAGFASSPPKEHGHSLMEHLEAEPISQERKGTNVYVSNLPASMTSSKFRSLFSPFGTIIGARLVKRRKGDAPVGFVQYTMAAMAQAAIGATDGKMIDGSKVSSRLANRDKDKGISNKPSSNLYVANLPQKATEQDLRMIFSRYGEIHSLRVLKYPNTGVSKGTALVRFVSMEDATRAKNALHCLPLQGQDLPLEVKYAETKEEKVARRDDRTRADKQVKAKQTERCNDEIVANMAAVTEEEEEEEEDEEGSWPMSPSLTSTLTQQEDVPACDLLAAQWNTSTFVTPIAQLGNRPHSRENSGDAMRALTDYIKCMTQGRPEAEYTENHSWNSQSSSIMSLGHVTDSLNQSDQFDESPAMTPPERFKLSANALPFVPKSPVPDWGLGNQMEENATDSIMVDGLPSEMDKLALYELFGPLGAVLKLESLLNADNCTRTAIVKFRTPAEASLAHSKLNGTPCKGKLLTVKMF